MDGKLGSEVYEVEEEEKGGNGKEGRRGGESRVGVEDPDKVWCWGGRCPTSLPRNAVGLSSLPNGQNFVVIYLPLSLCSLHIAGFCHQ